MPAIVNVTSNEAVCSFCHTSLDSLCVKCQKCKGQTHLSCTGLPEYQLVRLIVTSASYACMKCVETSETDVETYASELGKINQCKGREKKLREAGHSNDSIDVLLEANDSVVDPCGDQNRNTINRESTATSNDANEVNRPSEPPSTNHDQRPNVMQTPDAICQDYIMKKCRYGKSGKNGGTCRRSHPKLCLKYLRFGNRDNGCSQAQNCRFHHPKLCWQFNKNRECKRINCAFYHNTMRVQPRNRSTMDTRTESRKSATSRTENTYRARYPVEDIDRNQRRDTDSRVTENPQYFLSVQSQIQALTNQMQQFMQVLMLKEKGPDRQRLSTCRCGQQSL